MCVYRCSSLRLLTHLLSLVWGLNVVFLTFQLLRDTVRLIVWSLNDSVCVSTYTYMRPRCMCVYYKRECHNTTARAVKINPCIFTGTTTTCSLIYATFCRRVVLKKRQLFILISSVTTGQILPSHSFYNQFTINPL